MVQRFSHWSCSKAHDRVFMELQQAQIGIGASYLYAEQLLDVFGLGDGETALAGTQLHEHQLVVLTTLELERPTVGTIRNDRVPYVSQGQWPAKPRRVGRGEVANELPEESLQVAQLPSVI